jgi:serine phosphatase RsbU (regulator of sigma subunit)
MAICIVNTDTLQAQFAGANLPLYLIRKGDLQIFKGTNNPVGVYLREKPFESKQVQLQKGDNLYLFTNGYMDQFGGSNGGKFKITHFRDALLAISETEMIAQKKVLENIFEEWKNSKYEQTDDVLVMGIKI